MNEKAKEALKFLAHIVLTALASAIIAMLQNYLATHGVDAGPIIDPKNTAMIGAGVGTLTKAVQLS